MTGNPKRTGIFGTKFNEEGAEQRLFSFDQFAFPACNKCNNEFSDLEARTKPVIEEILDGGSVSAEQLSTAMDWFDKVRVGVWLGVLTLNKSQLDKSPLTRIEPKFHINSRVGQSDRVLIVDKFHSTRNRLSVGGVDSFSFLLTPSAFTVTINNVCFTSVSMVFLVSRRLGFPYPTRAFLDKGRAEVGFTVARGRERINNPILRKNIRERGKVFAQPMFANGLGGPDDFWYESKYVRDHSLNHEQGIGTIFEQTNPLECREYCAGDMIDFDIEPSLGEVEFGICSTINILEWQNWLLSFHYPDLGGLPKPAKEFFKKRFGLGKKFNSALIKKSEENLKRLKNNWDSG